MRVAEVMNVAERLAGEFNTLPAREVLDAVTGAVAELPDAAPFLAEQAARALLIGREAEGPSHVTP